MTLLHRAVERVGELEALDRVAAPLGSVVGRLLPPGTRVKDLLHGTWLGHPLHPLLTDIPIGSFTSATVLDFVGGDGAHGAADLLVDLGVVSALGTAAAGAADWSDTSGSARRLGAAHAVANTAGVVLYAWSALARRRNRRGVATLLGLAGMTVMSAAGLLGGHLTFARGVGVDANAQEPVPADWTALTEPPPRNDGATTHADANGAAVLVHRRGDGLLAIGDRCSHAGGPLHDGAVDGRACTVTCPWHGSVFRLEDGGVVHGPATVPQRAYDVRVVDGRGEVRARPAERAGS